MVEWLIRFCIIIIVGLLLLPFPFIQPVVAMRVHAVSCLIHMNFFGTAGNDQSANRKQQQKDYFSTIILSENKVFVALVQSEKWNEKNHNKCL